MWKYDAYKLIAVDLDTSEYMAQELELQAQLQLGITEM
jgi:hypothetical protein